MTLSLPPHEFTPGPVQCRLAHFDSSIWSQAVPLLQEISKLSTLPADSRFPQFTTLFLSLQRLHYGDSFTFHQPLFPGLQSAVRDLETAGTIDFFNTLLPSIVSAALRLTDYPPTLPLLPSGAPFAEVSIPRDFAYVLLANTFLGNHQSAQVYPEFSDSHPESWGDSSWLRLMLSGLPTGVERLKCQLVYFQTVANLPHLEGSILFRRASADFTAEIASCETVIPTPIIHNGVMEDRGNVIVDFANKYLHINQIIASATQEEILFSVRPECFLGLMFCQMMTRTDAIVIGGAQQLINYKGYGLTFQFDGVREGNFAESCDELVLAIDACVGRSFNPKKTAGDINKATVGFALCKEILGEAVISTGGWGTGAFGNDHKIKFLQQLVAAGAAGVTLHYSAYFKPEHEEWYNKLNEGVRRAAPRVCDLWTVLQGTNDSEKSFLAVLEKAGIFTL